MARMGRPSSYTQEIADEICRRIAEGESLAQICGQKRARRLPHRQTVYVWLAERRDFRRSYMRAREMQADGLFDEIVPIADAKDEDGAGPRDVSRDRLRVDARRYAAAKLAPRHYGDRVVLAEEPEASSAENRANRAARIAAILEAARRRLGGEG